MYNSKKNKFIVTFLMISLIFSHIPDLHVFASEEDPWDKLLMEDTTVSTGDAEQNLDTNRIKELSVVKEPDNTCFYYGEEPNIDGLVVEAILMDDSMCEIAADSEEWLDYGLKCFVWDICHTDVNFESGMILPTGEYQWIITTDELEEDLTIDFEIVEKADLSELANEDPEWDSMPVLALTESEVFPDFVLGSRMDQIGEETFIPGLEDLLSEVEFPYFLENTDELDKLFSDKGFQTMLCEEVEDQLVTNWSREDFGAVLSPRSMVTQARSWLGCRESDGSHRQIIDVYNSHYPLARNYKVTYKDSWCAVFVSACAIRTGLTDVIPTECSCERMIELFRNMGEWVENDAYVPRQGDIIFYDWNDTGNGDNTGWADHVGIVEYCDGDTITVIEGNKNDAVERRTIAVNGRFIRGFGVPRYYRY